MTRRSAEHERASSAPRNELLVLVGSSDPQVIAALLDNPNLDEGLLCRLLERKDLQAEIPERIAKTPAWMRSYPVRLRLARHPRTPRLISLAIVRQLYLFDLAQVSLLPSVPAEIRRLAEELILNRLEQLPLGEKRTLGRRGPGRVAAALLADGEAQVVPLALDNAFLNEGHILRVLARHDLEPRVVAAISRHTKWSYSMNVRIALIRNPLTPLARVMAFLPDIPLHDLRELARLATLRGDIRKYLEHEVAKRTGRKGAWG